jgi:hypothetical protein
MAIGCIYFLEPPSTQRKALFSASTELNFTRRTREGSMVTTENLIAPASKAGHSSLGTESRPFPRTRSIGILAPGSGLACGNGFSGPLFG